MVVQALVFAIGAATRIIMYAAHFTARGGRRGYLPLAMVAGGRGRQYCPALAAGARRLGVPPAIVYGIADAHADDRTEN